MEHEQNTNHLNQQLHSPQNMDVITAQPVVSPPSQVNSPAPTASNNMHSEYHSNPFALISNALVYIFQNNGTSGLLLVFLMMLMIGVIFAIGGIITLIFALLGPIGIIFFPIIFIAYGYFSSAMSGALFFLVINSFEGQAKKANDFIKSGFNKALPMFGLSIFLGIGTIIGFILLIVPGLIFLGWFALAPYAMVSENLGVFASMKRSKELSKGHIWEVFGAYTAGFILSGGGLLAPIVWVSGLGKRYEELKELKANGGTKPQVHWLNWLMPVFIFFVVGAYFALIAVSVIVSIHDDNKINSSNNSGFSNSSIST